MSSDEAVKKELMDLENRYWNAIRERDGATASALSDDPCLVVGAQGVAEIDRASLAKMLEGANYELKKYSIEDVRMCRLREDAVALAYKVVEELVVDGKNVTLQAFDSSVWHRRDGEWRCAVHTESPAGDPFGRH